LFIEHSVRRIDPLVIAIWEARGDLRRLGSEESGPYLSEMTEQYPARIDDVLKMRALFVGEVCATCGIPCMEAGHGRRKGGAVIALDADGLLAYWLVHLEAAQRAGKCTAEQFEKAMIEIATKMAISDIAEAELREKLAQADPLLAAVRKKKGSQGDPSAN
jgi:hypothetical protein